jgi:hypothetical protein
MSEYIVQVANQPPRNAVGFDRSSRVGGHDFGLDGDALTDFVRRYIAELLSRGAVPVMRGDGVASPSHVPLA